MLARICIAILVGVATWYGPGFYGGPLRCGGTYTEGTPPWAAVDPAVFQEGWECGDRLWVIFDDGTRLELRLADTGPLYDYYIVQYGPDVPIIVDIPEPFWPLAGKLSAPVTVINRSYIKRVLESRGLVP